MVFKKGQICWQKRLGNNHPKVILFKKQLSERMKKDNPAKQPKVREKLRKAKEGKVFPYKTRKNMSLAKKGKSHEEIYGIKQSKKLKKNLSKKLLLYYKNLPVKRRHTKKTKEQLRQSAYNHKPKFKDTKPELLLQEALLKEKIIFETQKVLFGVPDIFIKPNICIFVDGEYWHNYPNYRKKDIEVERRLKKDKFIVLRFWATHEIEKDMKKVITTIKKKIQTILPIVKQ